MTILSAKEILIGVILLIATIGYRHGTLAGVIFANPTSVEEDLQGAKDILMPNLGVSFKNVRRIAPSKDVIYATVSVPLPPIRTLLEMLAQDKFEDFRRNCCKASLNVTETGTRNVLQAYDQTIYKTKLVVKESLDILRDYIPALQQDIEDILPDLIQIPKREGHLRPKRFIGLLSLALTAINTGLDAHRTYHMQERLKAFTKDLDILEENQWKISNSIINLQDNLQVIAENMDTTVTTIYQEINQTNLRIDQLVLYVDSVYVSLMQNYHDVIQRFMLHQSVQLNQLLALNALKDLSFHSEHLLKGLVTAFHELELGKLPRDLISLKELDNLLQDIQEQMSVKLPDYELLSSSASEYFKSTTVMWGIKDYNVLISLPIYLKDKNQDQFDLFHAESFFVPTDVYMENQIEDDDAKSSYTKLALDYDHIAISGDVYILLSKSNLADCSEFASYLVCEDNLLHAHRSQRSCLSSLYYGDDISMIDQVCHVKYYHNVEAPANLFEDQHNLLMVNAHSDWKFMCEGDAFPTPITGMKYVLIQKRDVCNCKIFIGNSYYLPKRLNNCQFQEFNLKLQYPLNGILIYHLKDMMHSLDQSINLLKPLSNNVNLNIPTLQLVESINRSEILYDKPTGGVDLNKVAQLIKKQQTNYLTANDYLKSRDTVDNWFSSDTISLGISFVLGLIGTLSTFAICVIAARQCKIKSDQSAVIGGLMSSISKSEASSTNSCNQPIDASTLLQNEFEFRIYLLTGIIVLYLLYRFVKYVYRRYIEYRIVVPTFTNSNYEIHIYVEILNAQSKCRLYVISLSTSLLNVSIPTDISVTLEDLTDQWYDNSVKLNWTSGIIKLFKDSMLRLPTIIPVPLLLFNTVKHMTSGQYVTRILILQDVYYPVGNISHNQIHKDFGSNTSLFSEHSPSLDPEQFFNTIKSTKSVKSKTNSTTGREVITLPTTTDTNPPPGDVIETILDVHHTQ
jgi:hypothetical protein